MTFKKTVFASVLACAASVGPASFAEVSCSGEPGFVVCNDVQGSVNSSGGSSTSLGATVVGPASTPLNYGFVEYDFSSEDLEPLTAADFEPFAALTLIDTDFNWTELEGDKIQVSLYEYNPTGGTPDFSTLQSAVSSGTLLGTASFDTGGVPTSSANDVDFGIRFNSVGLGILKNNADTNTDMGIAVAITSPNGGEVFSMQVASTTLNPASGIKAVPEVSATGALAALGSLLAMMALLWERRRVGAAA